MESFNPNKQPDKDELRSMFVGKHLNELPTPMAVIDRRLVQAHCQKMLATCKALGVKFRPHVKTHKVDSSFYDFSSCQRHFLLDMYLHQMSSIV